MVQGPRAQWLLNFCVTSVLPAVAVSVPPLIYPHIFAFVPLSLVGYIILCLLFLCVSAVACRHDTALDCSTEPPLELGELSLNESSSSCRSTRRPSIRVSRHEGRLNVVTLDRLDKELASQSAASVMTALYTTDDLLTKVSAASVSYAIISYRQVRCKSDDFTLGPDAFVDAVSKAREAGVDAIWLDGWCYRQQGPYNHAAFCAELAEVMRNVTAVVWLPRSRDNATPSCALSAIPHPLFCRLRVLTGSRAAVPAADQFRLWCTFEASVVAHRRLHLRVGRAHLALETREEGVQVRVRHQDRALVLQELVERAAAPFAQLAAVGDAEERSGDCQHGVVLDRRRIIGA